MAPLSQGQFSGGGPTPLRPMPPARLERLLGDWRGRDHAYLELATALRGLAYDGRLPPGTRLPSERSLAQLLGLSRNTVTATLDLLRADGLLASRRGAGSWTTFPRGIGARPDGTEPSAAELDMTAAVLPAPARLGTLAALAASDLQRHLGDIGYDPYGLPELRDAIAHHLSARGVATRPDEVLVTQGALHGLDLVLRTLVRPGDGVLVESPTYPAALDAIAARGARALPIAIDDDGWDLPFLEATLATLAPRIAYLAPDHQNPTGVSVDESQRRALLTAARRSGTLVVVDEIAADLAFDDGPRSPRVAALDRDGTTITLGSLSKLCWAGLRVGWVRADPALIDRLARTRSASDVGSPVLDGLVAVRVLAELDTLVEDRRRLLVERRDALLDALGEHLPEWRLATTPRGGLCIWLELPAPISTRLAAAARTLGMLLAPGPRFDASGGLDHRLRLPLTSPDVTLEAVRRLAEAVRLSTPRGRARRTPEWVV